MLIKKFCSVDCEEVDQIQTSFLLTLDDGTKHKLLAHELHYLGFEEWKEFMLCIHKCRSLNADMKKKAINAVQKLLTKAKIMNEISVDEAYQSYIGLMPFKDPENQKFFLRFAKRYYMDMSKCQMESFLKILSIAKNQLKVFVS